MRKVLFLAVVAALATQSAYSQSPSGDAAKPLKTGEQVQLSESITFKVIRAAKSPFPDVKVQGQPVVVVLEVDSGKKNATISYRLSANSRLSDIYLGEGAQKIAPLAVIEDFPSWAEDNDKEVEVLDPAEKGGETNLSFQKKGSISLLFDVPAAQAKTPQKFSITVRAVKPTDEKHSFVVTL